MHGRRTAADPGYGKPYCSIYVYAIKQLYFDIFVCMLVIIFAYSNVTFSAPTNGYSNALLLNAGFGQATWLNAVNPMRE